MFERKWRRPRAWFEMSVIPSYAGIVEFHFQWCVTVRRYNGDYIQTKGLLEQIMADKIIGFFKQREQDRQPFLTYYAPHAIHAT
jgi:hypothetical protein